MDALIRAQTDDPGADLKAPVETTLAGGPDGSILLLMRPGKGYAIAKTPEAFLERRQAWTDADGAVLAFGVVTVDRGCDQSGRRGLEREVAPARTWPGYAPFRSELNDGLVAELRDLADRCSDTDSSYWVYPYTAALALGRLGEFEEAGRLLQRGFESARDPDTRGRIALAQMDLAAARGDAAELARRFQVALENAPHRAGEISAALHAYASEKLPTSELATLLRAAADLHPADEVAIRLAAGTAAAKSRDPAARADLLHVLHHGTQSQAEEATDALLRLGGSVEELDDATRLLAQRFGVDRDDLRVGLATRGRYASPGASVALCAKALQTVVPGPSRASHQRSCASVFEYAGEEAQTISTWRSLLSTTEGEAQRAAVARSLADALGKVARWDEAVAALDEQARATAPARRALGLRMQAGIRAKQGSLREAKRLAKKAIAADGTEPDGWTVLGDVLNLQGEHAAAAEAYIRGLNLVTGRTPAGLLINSVATACVTGHLVPRCMRRLAAQPVAVRCAISASAVRRGWAQPSTAFEVLPWMEWAQTHCPGTQLDTYLVHLQTGDVGAALSAATASPTTPDVVPLALELLLRGREPEALALFERRIAESRGAWNRTGELATFLLSIGRLSEAYALTQAALDKDPTNLSLLTAFKSVCWAQGEPSRATAAFERAVELAADPVRKQLVAALAGRRADAGAVDTALALYEQIAEGSGPSRFGHHRLNVRRLLLRGGDVEGALALCEGDEGIRRVKCRVDTLRTAGRIEDAWQLVKQEWTAGNRLLHASDLSVAAGDLVAAEEILRDVLVHHPQLLGPRKELARSLRATGRTQEAWQMLQARLDEDVRFLDSSLFAPPSPYATYAAPYASKRRKLIVDPFELDLPGHVASPAVVDRRRDALARRFGDTWWAQFNLARLAEKRGDTDAALAHYTKALALPRHRKARLWYPQADALIALGRSEEALATLREIPLVRDRTLLETRALATLGRCEDARSVRRRALSFDESAWGARAATAADLVDVGRIRQADELLVAGLSRSRVAVYAVIELAEHYARTGRVQMALDAVDSSLASNRVDFNLAALRRDLLANAGRGDEAVAAARRHWSLRPTAGARYQWALALARKGDADGARKLMARYARVGEIDVERDVEIALLAGDIEGAKGMLGTDSSERTRKLQIALRIAQADGDSDEADRLWAALRPRLKRNASQPCSLDGKAAYARALAAHGDGAQAVALADSLLARGLPEDRYAAAWVHYLGGDLGLARKHLAEARAAVDHPWVETHLLEARIELAAGDRAKAAAALDAAQQIQPRTLFMWEVERALQ